MIGLGNATQFRQAYGATDYSKVRFNFPPEMISCIQQKGYWDGKQCLASKPSAIPTWVWIAGGAAVVGVGAYFLFVK